MAAEAKFVEALKELTKKRIGYLPAQIDFLGEKAPRVVANFVRLYNAIMGPGALDVKTKELIGLALAVALGCTHCMEFHIAGAIEAGATDEEIAETLAVVIAMTGGPGLVTWSEPAVEMLKKIKGK